MDTCHTRHEPVGHCAKISQTHRRSLEESDPQRQKGEGGGQELGVGKGSLLGTVSLWEVGDVLEADGGTAAQR